MKIYKNLPPADRDDFFGMDYIRGPGTGEFVRGGGGKAKIVPCLVPPARSIPGAVRCAVTPRAVMYPALVAPCSSVDCFAHVQTGTVKRANMRT